MLLLLYLFVLLIIQAFLQVLLRQNNLKEAEDIVLKAQGPVRFIMQEALKHYKTSRENLEELLNESVIGRISPLDRYLSVLSVGAASAPLLGLLGTVMGMIKTFELISVFGTGDARPLSSGISEALVTTEVGLCVAIPALIWYAFLNRRVRGIAGNLQKSVLSFLNYLSLEKSNSSNVK